MPLFPHRLRALAGICALGVAMTLSAQAPKFMAPPQQADPGQEVAIPVDFNPSGMDVCAVSADVSFDTSRLTFGGAEAGPAAQAAGKNLVSQPMGTGTVRLALIGYNSIPMSGGPVFVLRFTVLPTAGGAAGITLRGGAATCAGQDLPSFATTCVVNVRGGGEPAGGDDKGKGSGDGEPAPADTGAGQTGTATSGTVVSGGDSAGHAEEAEAEGSEEEAEEAAAEAPSEPGEAKPLDAKAVVSNKKGSSPLMVALRAQVEGGRKPYKYAWEFGDDAEKAGTKMRERHRYTKPGTYRPSLEVTDADGETVSVECDEVTVLEPPVPEVAGATYSKVDAVWNLEVTGAKFQKGCTATVNGKDYETEFASSKRVLVRGIADPAGKPVKVSVANPYGKGSAEAAAQPKAEAPGAAAK